MLARHSSVAGPMTAIAASALVLGGVFVFAGSGADGDDDALAVPAVNDGADTTRSTPDDPDESLPTPATDERTDGPDGLTDTDADGTKAAAQPQSQLPVADEPADADPASVDADAAADPIADGANDTDGTADEEAEHDDFGDDGEPAIDLLATSAFDPVAPTSTWSMSDLVAVGGQDSPSPCDLAEATHPLIVSPGEVVLASDADSVDVAVTWCGSAPTTVTPSPISGGAWNAKGPLSIDVGQTIDTSVFVQRDHFPVGAFTVDANLVAADGAVGTVTVHGMSFGPFGVGSVSGAFTAGAGAAGCSGSCITSAQLVPGPDAGALGLDVTTDVLATFDVYLLTGPPMFLNGELAGATPVISTTSPRSSWSTRLGDLSPTTTYHLVLAATDVHDRTQWATHAFTTLPAPSQYTGNDPEPGCSAGCVVEAQLSPTADHDVVGLHVETHTPAKITAQVGTELKWTDGQPVVAGHTSTDSTFAEYETSWDATFTGLAGDTTYHVLVRATDDNGRTDIRTGQFHTEVAPPVGVIVRFEELLVRWDADSSTINRGELRFIWGIDDTKLGARGEAKHHTGDQITLETDTHGWFVPFEPGEPHLFTLAGGERDPQIAGTPCEATDGGAALGIPLWRQQDRNDCDNVKWNTAPMWMTAEEIADLPWCSEYGLGGPAGNRKCHDIDTPDYGPDVPRFTSIVSFDVID